MLKLTSKQITLTALFITMGVIFPILFHQVALSGRIFLPMHIPVFLAGIFVGPVGGLIVGLVCPGLSFLLTGMPPPYAVPLMSLGAGGLWSLHRDIDKIDEIPHTLPNYGYDSGSAGFCFGAFLLWLVFVSSLRTRSFIKVSVVTGLPGIALQLVLIPLLMEAIQWAKR